MDGQSTRFDNYSVDHIEKALLSAASLFSKAYDAYYPCDLKSESEANENNQALYLGHVLLKHKGWVVFMQPQCVTHNQHIDLFAVNCCDNSILALECKRLYSAEKAASFGRDFERLARPGSFHVRHGDGWGHLRHGCHCFMVLTASTWKPHYMNWWVNKNRPEHPATSRSSEPWTRLREALQDACRCGARPIFCSQDENAWFLYAIVSLGVDFWRANK